MKRVIIIILTLVSTSWCYGQNGIVRFHGNAKIDGEPCDSVVFIVEPIRIKGMMGIREFKGTCNKQGDFDVRIDSITTIQRIAISYQGKRRVGFPLQYIEPGDDVEIGMVSVKDSTKVDFKGTGSAKYNYNFDERQIGSFPDFLLNKDLPPFKQPNGIFGYSKFRAQHRLSTYNNDRLKLAFLKYKAQMSHAMQQLIETDLEAREENSIVAGVDFNYFRSNDGFNPSEMIKFYRKGVPNSPDTTDAEIKVLSEPYINYLRSRTRLDLYLTKGKREASIQEMYTLLKASYTGLIREAVVFSYLSEKSSSGTLEEYRKAIEDALSYFKHPVYTAYLKETANKIGSGVAAYEFELPDIRGKMVKLSGLKGKVVLIDIWFTGCIPCATITKTLRDEVKPSFPKNKKVVFLSVGVDKDRKMWEKSVKEGVYTDPTAINLFTNGKAFEHPFIKFYKITGCPTLLLIDKNGKLVSHRVAKESKEIIALINQHL